MFAPFGHESHACLTLEDVRDLEAGNLDNETFDRYLDHISSCQDCELIYMRCQDSPEDELLAKVRKSFSVDATPRNAAILRIEGAALDQTQPLVVRNIRTTHSDASSLRSIFIGARIGQHVVEAEIGRGGMGVVFRAWHEVLNRRVALKFIRSGVFAEAEVIARFRREAGAIARLHHPNVATLFDFAEHDGLPYFTMEMVEGGSLAALLLDGPLDCRRAAELTRTIAEAVDFAHRNQVIHRDLKPSNILLTSDGDPKIADFGLAKLLDDNESHATRTDAILGTPSYMSPEQAKGGSAELGVWTDIYALGAILYECLTGRPPHRGKDRDETLRRVQRDNVVPPSKLIPAVPRALEAICLKCLHKLPGRRYKTAEALAADLRLWLDHKPPVGIPSLFRRGLDRLVRHRVLATVVTVGIAATAALALHDPDRSLKELQSRIKGGQSATLLPENGSPVRYRWIDGESTSKVSLDAENKFRVDAFELALLELIPAVNSDRYRFQVRVRHERSNLHGGVGIFVARKPHEVNGETIQSFFQMDFNDVRGNKDLPIIIGKRPMPKMVNMPRAFPRFMSLQSAPNPVDVCMIESVGPKFDPPGVDKTHWRDIALIVSPEVITAEWEGQRFQYHMSNVQANIQQQRDYLNPRFPQNRFLQIENPTIDLQGGVGLLVYGGTAVFESAIVIPETDR